MPKTKDLILSFEKAYNRAREQEQEELHNAIVDVLHQHSASIANALLVLELLKFELLNSKHQQVLKAAKLSSSPPGNIEAGSEE